MDTGVSRGGNSLAVRGNAQRVSSRALRRNLRLPPQAKDSHRQRTATPEILSRPKVKVHRLTLFEILGGTSENPAPSKFGGTTLERCIDNAAARLGYEFDAAQFNVSLTINGSYTVIDRVRFHPRVAVYIDGIQHDIRIDAETKDFLQKLDLESMGWKVIRLNWKDIMRDPIGAARSVMYVV